MALTAAKLAENPQLFPLIREQCVTMLAGYDSNPRLGAIFATQQRWLLAHAALAVFYDRDPGDPGTRLARFLDIVRKYSIASVNTADAFMKEAIQYGIVEAADTGIDRRARLVRPSQEALQAIRDWALAHLQTLDRLDGGARIARFLSVEDAIARLEPAIAYGLLTSPAIRQPQKTFSLFTWLNNGGVIMDWLITGMSDPEPGCARIGTRVGDIDDLVKRLRLSRTHLTRKLREAEEMGSLGWEGARWHSAMWVSRGFLDEILLAQANKLAVIDAAFEERLGQSEAKRVGPSPVNLMNPPNKSQPARVDRRGSAAIVSARPAEARRQDLGKVASGAAEPRRSRRSTRMTQGLAVGDESSNG
jgi:hypothetical protein